MYIYIYEEIFSLLFVFGYDGMNKIGTFGGWRYGDTVNENSQLATGLSLG